MAIILSIHSFRGGTGKSNTTANLAAVMAMQGKRVGVMDTDIQSPGIHVIFGLTEDKIKYSLNDYLWNKCDIQDAAYDVTGSLGKKVLGKIFLIPSSIKTGEITRIMREGYDVNRLNDGLQNFLDELKLDALLIDTHPGLNEETLISIALSNVLIIVLRPDQQDYQGTSVTVEIARRLNVPNLMLVLNKVPSVFNFADLRAQVEKTYACPVAAVLPHSDEMMTLQSAGIFACRYPDHPITKAYQEIVARLPEE